MTSLLKAELRRIAARRLARMTVVLIAVGVVIGGGAAFLSTAEISQATYEQRMAAAELSRATAKGEVQKCLQAHGVDPDARSDVSDEVAKACFSRTDAHADDPRFHRKNIQGVLQGVSGVLAIVGWTIGASLVGAEFASRGMTTLLTWEPRRARVFAAKAVAVVIAIAVLACVTLVALIVALLPALVFHGGPLRPNDPSMSTLAGIVLRGTALATISAGLGFSLATIGRNTAAALGAGFAYVIVLENIVGSYHEGTRRWLLLGNVIVFVSGHNDGEIPGRTVTGAAIFLSLVAITFLAGAFTSFRARDIA